jgi:hypothetical protein
MPWQIWFPRSSTKADESAMGAILQFQKVCWMVESGPSRVTLSRSEGSLALGHEMLRCGSA